MSERGHHGNTPAAWSAVALGSAGSVVGAIGLMLEPINLPLFWIGLAMMIAGIPLYVVMTRMGLGQPQN